MKAPNLSSEPQLSFSSRQLLYAGAAVVFISLALSRFALIIEDLLRIEYNLLVEAGIVAGQVLFQWVFLWRRPFADKWLYATQVIMVSLMGAVLLVPLIGWHWARGVSVAAALVYFFGVVGFMFLDHWRRVRLHGFPGHLCATWVLYRCLLLVLVVEWR